MKPNFIILEVRWLLVCVSTKENGILYCFVFYFLLDSITNIATLFLIPYYISFLYEV